MQQTHWHLEIYEKDLRSRRQREAQMARQVHAATGGRQASFPGSAVLVRVRRMVAGLRWPSRESIATAQPARSVVAREVSHTPTPSSAAVQRFPAVGRRSRLADPYATMAIVARGPAYRTAEEPYGVRERH